ncbi:MAG: hypothetical protein ACE5FU_03360, partial [Nitrospinota bacterium]
IPPGRFAATINYGDDVCHFTLALPDTGEIITDLGEVVCHLETFQFKLPAKEIFEKIWGTF